MRLGLQEDRIRKPDTPSCQGLFGTIDLKLMFRRLWTITIASWALVGLPSLCTAGVLTHPCEPEESHHPVRHSHDENEGGCHHESDCAQDPCSELTVRIDRDDSQSVLCNSVLLASEFLPPSDCTEHDILFCRVRIVILRLPHLPCHESVLPLLI